MRDDFSAILNAARDLREHVGTDDKAVDRAIAGELPPPVALSVLKRFSDHARLVSGSFSVIALNGRLRDALAAKGVR